MTTIADLQATAAAALTEAKAAVAAKSSQLAAAKTTIDTLAAELADSKAAHDAIAVAHAAAAGTMRVAPTAESLLAKVKPYVIPGGAVIAGAAAYAHWGLKLF
jgi:hypothetical protein